MYSVGNRIRWFEGKILFPSQAWISPSKRRIPRLLIEERAKEVGILIFIDGDWVVFAESKESAHRIKAEETQELPLYAGHYHLIPRQIRRQNSYQWLMKKSNALLFWGTNNRFYVKPVTR